MRTHSSRAARELVDYEWVRFGAIALSIAGTLVFLGTVLRTGNRGGRIDVLIGEHLALETLDGIVRAQARLAASEAIDANGDGVGEYGFLSELTGRGGLRSSTGALALRLLPEGTGELVGDGRGHGVLEHRGYRFRVFLPGPLRFGLHPGIAEPADPGALGFRDEVDPDAAARHWCCYAWPVEPGRTGQRVFFVNERQEVLQLANERQAYAGPAGVTAFELAYVRASMDADLVAPAPTPGPAWTTVDPRKRPPLGAPQGTTRSAPPDPTTPPPAAPAARAGEEPPPAPDADGPAEDVLPTSEAERLRRRLNKLIGAKDR